MKILHVVYDLIRGGTEGQCALLAEALSKRAFDNKVAVFHRRGFYLKSVEISCGTVYEIAIRDMHSLNTLRELKKFKAYIISHGFDLIHAWDADACIFGALVSRWTGIPIITSHRDLGEIYPWHKVMMMKWADKRASAVVVNARIIAESLICRHVSPEKVHVIPNMLNFKVFDEYSTSSVELPNGFRMVLVSRLDPEKNIGLMIKAMSILVKEDPSVHLIIAGDGKEKKQLIENVQQLELSENVHFLGNITDIPSLLKGAHIGILIPSKNEGLSNSIIEYMAAGLPVITSDCGGNKELVKDDEAGYVLNQIPSAEDICEKCLLLKRHNQLRQVMGKNGRRYVESNCSITHIAEQFENLYWSIFNKQ